MGGSEPSLGEEMRRSRWRSLRIFLLPAIVALVLYAFYAIGGYGNHEPPVKPLKHGAIYGTVMDEKQHPISGISVAISLSSSKEAIPGEGPPTDAQGHFYLPDLPAGTYILQATAEGYALQTQRVNVDPGATVQIKIPLYPVPTRPTRNRPSRP